MTHPLGDKGSRLDREQIERIRATFRMFSADGDQKYRLDALCNMALEALSAREPTSFTLTPQQLADLCTFSFGMSCDAPEDAMPITVGYLPKHESGPGWYAWGEELPEEGSVPIHGVPTDGGSAT